MELQTESGILREVREILKPYWSMAVAKMSDLRNVIGIPSSLEEEAQIAFVQANRKHEVVVKLLSTLLGLGLTFGITYYGIHFLMKAMDPTRHERVNAIKRAESLLRKIGVANVQLTDYELCIASNLVDPLTIVADWKDIGGMQHTIQDIQDSLILPFKHRNLFFNSTLVQPPKGVLLYGPPGCGKTMIAKATAKATGARFINLQVSSLFDKWYGESQKHAEAVFSLARKLQPTIIFIDEIDSFLRSRNAQDHETTAMVKTQFMSLWDGLLTDPHCQIMIMGATNRPADLDAAILRRLPVMFHIKLPTRDERVSIMKIILQNEQVDESVDISRLAARTEGFTGSDLRELCRSAAICRVNDYLRNELSSLPDCQRSDDSPDLRPITMGDFDSALRKWSEGDRLRVKPVLELLNNVDVD